MQGIVKKRGLKSQGPLYWFHPAKGQADHQGPFQTAVLCYIDATVLLSDFSSTRPKAI